MDKTENPNAPLHGITLAQQRKKTDLWDVFNLMLYFSIKSMENRNKFEPLFERIFPPSSLKEDQTKSV